MKELAITGTNCITAIGHDGRLTAASVRAGISRFAEYENYLDASDNPITVAHIKGMHDSWDTAQRMADIAALCLENLLAEYFQNDARRPTQIHLFLGAASVERPGLRYEETCRFPLLRAIGQWTDQPVLHVVPRGNASMAYAIDLAHQALETDPAALCVIGGVDSLIRTSTLNWFEKESRLKSATYGRHHALIAGEAAGFLLVEARKRAEQENRPIMARIAGLGLAKEPVPRASGSIGRNSGLTDACHVALSCVGDNEIRTVFADLNGENHRAKEWGMAEIRCFEKPSEDRKLWTPANCYGDIGAASGVVLATIATQGFVRGWVQSPALVICSDDHGACGAVVLDI